MGQTLEQVLVRNILAHAGDHPWRIQSIGVLALWLDDERNDRLHVWAPDDAIGDPPIHDHPFGFTSTVVVGELVNTRYVEQADGTEHVRERYAPANEQDRQVDTVRLVGVPETVRAGARYHQVATELHDSRQVPGTVTVMRTDRSLGHRPELTVCRRPGTPWPSGQARPATDDEVKRITAAALALFDAGMDEPRES
jgi:hypothetical protein